MSVSNETATAVLNRLDRTAGRHYDRKGALQWVTARIDASAAIDPARAAADVFKDYDHWREGEGMKLARRPARPPRKRAPRLVLLNDITGEPMGQTRPVTVPWAQRDGLELLDDDPGPPPAAA